MHKMFLLQESPVTEVKCLTESDGDKKSYFIEGPFMVANTKNKNGRLYPLHIMENAISEYLPAIREKRSVGELGHPATPTINQDRVSHLITNLWFEGNEIYGKAKVLPTPMGKIVQTFLDEGIKIGVSSRGMGSLKQTQNGIMEVQNDFRISTVDIVNDPSGPNCFVQGIMEQAAWLYENGQWIQAEQTRKAIKKMSPRKLEESKFRLLQNFLKTL